ncbi:MAG: DHHA1 domain-containing protein [Thermoanaerobacterium sp.]|nr:DHHA1 domain-containing protein [Thermoanaerobacterium sp.]
MVEKLYYHDSYKSSFSAEIVDINFANGYYEVLLDETYFYPESGGQPADGGFIDGIKVENVILRDDKVIHVLKTAPKNKFVNCEIDWEKRFDNMQQHSGQHLLSAVFYKLFNAETESFSIGRDSSHITLTNSNLSEDNIKEVEIETNRLIYSNLPIITYFIGNEELKRLPLRKKPKVDENIRIVEIKDFDYSPCGGTHVKSLGEIGIVKIKKFERTKKGLRIEFVCGFRAFNDYLKKNNYINSLITSLSAKEEEILEKVDKILDENKELKKELIKLRDNILQYEAEKLIAESINLKNFKLVAKIFNDKDMKELRTLSQIITKEKGIICILCSTTNCGNIVISRSDDVDVNINSFFKTILDVIEGNGGGNQKTCQGSGKIDNLDLALDKAISLISNY